MEPVRACIALLLCGGLAIGSGDPSEYVESVLEQLETQDLQTLDALLGAPHPDPWLVADELLGLGKKAAAIRWARRVAHHDSRHSGLVACIDGCERELHVRSEVRRAALLVRAKEPRNALSVLEGLRASGGILGWRLEKIKSDALVALGRFSDSEQHLLRCARIVAKLDWPDNDQDIERIASRALKDIAGLDNDVVIAERLGAAEVCVLFLEVGGEVLALAVRRRSSKVHLLGSAQRLDGLIGTVLLSRGRDAATWRVLRSLVWGPLVRSSDNRVIVAAEGVMAEFPFTLATGEKKGLVVSHVPLRRLWQWRAVKKPSRRESYLFVGDNLRQPRLTGVDMLATTNAEATAGALISVLVQRPTWRCVQIATDYSVKKGCMFLATPPTSGVNLDLSHITEPWKGMLQRAAERPSGALYLHELGRTGVRADLIVLDMGGAARRRHDYPPGTFPVAAHRLLTGSTQNLLVPLWSQDRQSTREFFRVFHRAWRRNTSAAVALSRATNYMRASGKGTAPEHWAAWQLWSLSD